jgi:hypothetical protein
MNYNLTQQNIDNLNDINENNTKIYYKYRLIDFYYKKKDNSDKLLITFHGSNTANTKIGRANPIPIFRCYCWNYNILCISDVLLELYPNINLGWYLSPLNTNIKQTYIEIIQFFLNKYKNVIFYGSSGGGFPSLLFSSYFQKKAFIQNSQIYLNKYFNIFDRILKETNMKITDIDEINGEQIIQNYGLPQHLIFYCNTNDTHNYTKHYLPFLEFINQNNWNKNFTFIHFLGDPPIPPQSDHNVNFPSNSNIFDSINELFDSYNNDT